MITNVVKFTKKVAERGNALELRVKNYLDSMSIPHKYQKRAGIDFIIQGCFYMDCIAQGISGSIGDKLPTKCFKYIRLYNLKDIYILQPYSPINRVVGEHLEHLEQTHNCNIHILDWKDFTYLMNGGKFESRNPYNYGKSSRHISNNSPNNNTLNRFLKL